MEHIFLLMIISNVGFAVCWLRKNELTINNRKLKEENALLKKERDLLLNEKMR